MVRRHAHLIDCLLKWQIDLVAACCLLVLLLPVFLAIAILVAMDGGPIFYRHRRVGRGGRPFDCWKFRTMVLDADVCLAEYLRFHPEAMVEWQSELKLARDPRVTSVGAMLRKLSLDELPQLWNVVIGDMSLVGPRPVTESELRDKYGSRARLVTTVKPGLTGLWQISGRNDIDYAQRIAMDISYVNSRNLALDLIILARTPRIIFAGTGAR